MEDLVANQEQLVSAMEQLFSSFKKTGRERRTADYIKRKLDTLDTYWRDYEANHAQLGKYPAEAIPYDRDTRFDQVLQFYNNAKVFIQQSLPVTPIRVEESRLLPTPSPSRQDPSSLKVGNPEKRSQATDSKTAELLKKQASQFRAFSRTVEDIDLEAVTETWEFEDLLRQLNTRWAAIDSLHLEIDSELNGTDEEYEKSFLANEKTYKFMKKVMSSKLWSVSHRAKTTPQMEIPTFSGNYYQWVSFKDLFTETIHGNPSLNNAQKMQFLKSKVRGEAEKLIQHLSINSDNYQVCWELLNNRYHNKRLIFTSHVNILLNLPVMQHPNVAQIKRIHDTTNECLNSIKNLGVDVSSWDPLLVQIMSLKLDTDTFNDYLESLKQPRELPTLKEFLQFLEIKFTTMESSVTRRKQDIMNKSSNSFPIGTQKSVKSANYKSYSANKVQAKIGDQNNRKINHPKYSKSCPICSEEHGIYFCQQFLSMSADAKRKTITKYNLCKNCLYDHHGNTCFSTKTCRECNDSHNTIMHDAYANASTPHVPKNVKSNPGPSSASSYVSQKGDSNEIFITTAVIKVQARDGTYHKIRALLDQCSQMSLITEKAAQLLQLPRARCKDVVSGVGQKESSCKGILKLSCASVYNDDFKFNVDAYIMNKIVKNLPSKTRTKQDWTHLEGLQLADSDFNISRPIDIILGSDIFPELILDGVCKGRLPSMPVAQRTELGWIICGSSLKTKSHNRQCNVIINNMDDIQQFWEIEEITEDKSLSEEDNRCISYFEETTLRKPDGRYQVRLPLNQEYEKQLGNSKPVAVGQFYQLERKFKRNNNLKQDYLLFINEYISLGHMKLVSSYTKPDYYMPHHCVLREDSETTKLRVVFNASSKSVNGSSLNDVMYRGPNLQKDLQCLLLRWRQYQIAFTADIEKMYRQIWVHEEDQNLQKIVWRDAPSKELSEYQLSTVTYGTKAAPFLAMMTLQQLAKDEQDKYPEGKAITALKESFYMDDVLHGTHCLQSAKEVQKDLSDILKSGGFNLRKWASNSTELLKQIESEEPKQDGYSFRRAESTKTLGLRWDSQKDVFLFQCEINPNVTDPTKRSMLSDLSKLFDPLGWLSPVTTSLKSLFQSVWQTNLQWDDKLPKNIKSKWVNSIKDVENIKHYQVQRWLGITQENQSIELHGFCDASSKAYACVIYCKMNTETNCKINIVAGKVRLVPISKNISIPKLELMGAHLLSKLMFKVLKCLDKYNIKINCWVDSMVVLGWLNGEPNRWKPFVENRVSQIREVIPAESWRYIKSEENPADCASRGLSATQLKEHSLWWQGPSWLQNEKLNYDVEQPKYFTDQEVRKSVKQVNVITNQENYDVISVLITRFSNFLFIIRVVAWLRRLKIKKQVGNISYLTIQEIRQATIAIMKHHQEREFYNEMASIQEGKSMHNKSKLLNLHPFIDDQGLLRVGGRLRNSHINQERKYPIIIANGRLAELLIDYAHQMTYHGGAKLCLAFIRQKYWILGGIRTVKKQLRQCVTCRKHDPFKLQQLMGDLPESRCNPSPRAFYHTGVDFTGYVAVKANKGRGIKTTKGYIAVFVCMATKAIHLELVSDLTTSSFIAALRRMAARRGTPRHIYSDNGTNFVGANNIIQKEIEQLINNKEIMKEVTGMEITWHFNAPSWPSAGGLWEAAVKSLKYHLKRVIGEQHLTFEEYSTLLAQVEACLNSRPLCPISEDPDDLDYLTPAHFLTGGSSLTLMETERDLRTRWNLTQKIVQDTWRRWRSEYLDQLTVRSKWKRTQDSIKLNDIVLIHDDNLPAGKWLMGRVIELHPGTDGNVRVVTLKTKNGFLKRPIIKLSILPTNSSERHEQTSSKQNQQSAENSKPKQRFSFNSVVMVLLFFMTMISNAACSYNISELQEKQMMYFDKVSDMRLIRDEWKILAYYDMNPYKQGVEALSKYIKYLDDQCLLLNKGIRCDMLVSQLRHGFSELKYYNHMLMSQHSRTRQKRGLIDGVGSIANSLFGVLDQKFAEQYRKDIELIKTNQNHMASLWKNQTSIIESEYDVLKRTESLIDKQHKTISQHLMTLDAATSRMQQEMQYQLDVKTFTLTSVIANNMLQNLRNIQDVLSDTIIDIYHGRFNPHLISPEQLKRELSKIASQVPRDLALPVDDIQNEIKNIYQLLSVKTRTTQDYCLFEITVPLVSHDLFEVYNLIPIPQQSQNNKITIMPKTAYVGINLKKDLYMTITDMELKECLRNTEIALCRLQNPINHLTNDNDLCELNYKTHDCEIKIKPCSHEWIRMNNINTFMYFCCDECQVRILCEDQVTAQQLSRAGIISLGQGCMIKTRNFTIYSHRQMSSDLKIVSQLDNPYYIPPINHVMNFSMPKPIEDISQPETSDTQEKMKEIHDRIRCKIIENSSRAYHIMMFITTQPYMYWEAL